ncbi:ABC transporter substrate-binding protein [Pullulanibacillus camelliae]|uniref:ABC transporter substrate-binding protein n=1 Tax=Pullulanibacillus camelliae TaxID=1707096 RepID=A0A8J2VN67_9BACL|nr:extracellular solute-binding protein [Pullulanibacillus camelliae]GGE33030.1 ABC transporter substrate-binding protein [Pullulanibacillus camelliae]
MKIRRGISVTVVILILLMAFLTGCDSKKSSSSSSVTLNVTEWTNPSAIKATKKLNKEFEKAHPGVHVHLVDAPTSSSAWDNLNKTQMSAHTVDVMAQFSISNQVPKSYMKNLQPSMLEQWIDAGQIKDLTNEPFIDKYFSKKDQMNLMGYKGKLYGVTMAAYGRGGVFYNEALFKKYNLSIPKTYDQLVHVCEVFASHNITPLMVGAKDGWDQMIVEAGIQQSLPHDQADTLNKELWTGKTTWANQPVFKTVMERYQKLSQYFEPNAFGEPYAPTPGLFANGKAAMLVDGTFDGDAVHQANPNLKFSWFPLPMTDDPEKNTMQVAGDFSWTIPTAAPHQKLALEYVKFFSQPKHYKEWENIVGAIPTQDIKKLSQPWMGTELEYLDNMQYEFHIFTPSNAGDLAYLQTDTAYLKPQGKYTVDQLLKKATQQWTAATH